MNYPNGVKYTSFKSNKRQASGKSTFSNRGMTLEEDINTTNERYLVENKAVIHKKPTPIQIVNVHYPKRSAAVITEAYFKSKSTTDYNGVYRGKYIDFEAKETKNKTRFPLANIHKHQFEHMRDVISHHGICFVIMRFTTLNKTYYLDAKELIAFEIEMTQGKRKSIDIEEVEVLGYLIPLSYPLCVNYLNIVDKLYF